MAVVTGAHGALRYQNVALAKCRNFSLDINRDALESTTLGSYDRTFVEGIRGATGSTTILYDNDDTSAVQLLNSILSNISQQHQISLVLNTLMNKELQVNAIITQASVPVSVGEVTACSVNFTVTGPIEGSF